MMTLKTHNVLDYVLGAALVLAPFLFGFSHVVLARDVFVVAGLSLIGYSLITDYDYSIGKIISVGMHMTFDVATGLFLMLAPAIYSYYDEITGSQFALHFVYGIGAIALVVLTAKAQRPPAIKAIDEEEAVEPTLQKAA